MTKNFPCRLIVAIRAVFCLWLLSTGVQRVTADATPAPSPAVSSTPTPEPSGLWLGDPDLDLPTARARFRARFEAVIRREADDNVGYYNRFGKKDPRWDDDAREVIRQASATWGFDPAVTRAAWAAEKAACERALKAGCDDPFIYYISLRIQLYPPGIPPEDLARLYAKAERKFAASDYPPLRKYCAAARAAQNLVSARRATDNTVGMQMPGYSEPAVSWPDGTDPKAVFQHGFAQLKAMLNDPPPSSHGYAEVTNDFFRVASSDPIGRAEVLVPLARLFESAEYQQRHASHAAKLIEGKFWTDYAWDARGGGWGSTVTDEGGRLFAERLEKAVAALEAAWKLDPQDPEAPTCMIPVLMGQGGERDEMEKWFRRAMDTRPNDYNIGVAKALFLDPKWGGSEEDSLEFGHQCLATHDWTTRMPFILLHVHWKLSGGDRTSEYWRKPEVWADLRNLFEPYLAANPGDVYDQTTYALYAFQAQDWKKARELFEQIGDKPDAESLDLAKTSPQRFQEMRREIPQHLEEGEK